ncbi:MAG TPA: hypothetical protein VMV74_07060 [Bacteroidales bacterium]|nr:hypothetical protein [Bacteroidales bacterium]
MKKATVLVISLLLFSFYAGAQVRERAVSAGGYTSWLHSAMFDSLGGEWINSSMLHNRVNLKAYAGQKITFNLEVRNRFITGDMVRFDPRYSASLDSDVGWADLSWNVINERSFIFNTTIDRAWIDFTAGKLQVRAGRQRINWSQSLVWNPNDIFNTYSFFDFDYIERPGSDAVRMIYSTSPSSAAEMAVKINNEGKVTAAALYRFNIRNIDLQILAGETDENTIVGGFGWSGSIGSYSIRGEATWFQPFENIGLSDGTVIFTAGIDKSFSERLMAVSQVMYCNNPLELSDFDELYSGELTASQLAFSEFTLMGQLTYTPMPLLNITASAIWYPDLDGFFAGPSIDYSLAENVDFSFLWQHFSSIIGGTNTRINLGFIRIKYSF